MGTMPLWAGVALAALTVIGPAQTPAHAQAKSDATAKSDESASASNSDEMTSVNEVIVTARKTAESDLRVPVAISALGKAQLERYNIATLSDVAAMTPSLNISTNFGSQGGAIALRGISAAPLNAASEQSVALSFDGVTVSSGDAVRFSQFDLERIEVLKGPQSLYYGKNTTAGIISVISADPTKDFYAMARVGHEFNATETTTEGVISGPVAGERLTARLAFYRTEMQGWLKNPLAYTDAVPPQDLVAFYGPLQKPDFSTLPNYTDWATRGTLKFEASDDLTIRLKGTYGERSGSASNQLAQLYYCAAGVPAPGNPGNVPGIGHCGSNNNWGPPIGQNYTAAQAGDPLFGNGQPFEHDKQYLLVNDINWKMTKGLSLDSVTGYYDLQWTDGASVSFSPYPAIDGINDLAKHDFSQELRLTSDFDSPFNFMLGLYYDKGKFFQHIPAVLGIPGVVGPVLLPGNIYDIPNEVRSAFGNFNYKLLDRRVTLSAGGRYTWEKKTVEPISTVTGAEFTDLATNKFVSPKFNPELSVLWTPDNHTTFFVTYKKGSKSGGFNADPIATLYPGKDISYKDESVKGFEGGLKSILADGALRFDITAFSYEYTDLQVGNYDAKTNNQTISNAASAKLDGVELSMNYYPPSLRGLAISGSLDYDKARYSDYYGICYIGQTVAAGCAFDAQGNPVDGVTKVGLLQNFAGRPLNRAPLWSGSINVNYDTPPAANGDSLGLSINGVYTDSFYPMTPEPPTSRQQAMFDLSGQVRVFNDDRGWELALIGKNLLDERRVQIGVETPFTPGPLLNAGTGTNGPALLADQVGYTNRPRELWLRLTVNSNVFKLFK